MAKNFLVTDFEFTVYTKPVGKPRGFFSEILEIGATKLNGETFERVGDIRRQQARHTLDKKWIVF